MQHAKRLLWATDRADGGRAHLDALDRGHQVAALGAGEAIGAASRDAPIDALVLFHSARSADLVAAFFAAQPASTALIVHIGEQDDVAYRLAQDHHSFVHYDPGIAPADLAEALKRQLTPRVEQRLQLNVDTVRGRDGGTREPFACRVLNLSNRGLSFVVPAWMDVRGFLPGKQLSELQIFRGQRCVIRAGGAAVRSTVSVPLSGAEPGYRVGVEFSDGRAAPDAGGEPSVVGDPVAVTALLRDAFKHRCVWMAPAGLKDRLEVQLLPDTKLGGATFTFVAPCDLQLEVGSALQMTFEARGERHWFFTGVVEVAGARQVVVRSPRSLFKVRHRRGGRHSVDAIAGLQVAMEVPFGPPLPARSVVDLSLQGLGIVINPAIELLPVGTQLDAITLALPNKKRLSLRGVVRSLTFSGEGDRRQAKCGIEFSALSTEQQLDLFDVILNGGLAEPDDGLKDASGATFDEVWAFLRLTGFLHPDKEKKLHVPEVRRTFTALLSRPNELSKTLVYRREGQIVGHLAGIKAYSKTWLTQHLGATKRRPDSPQVIRMMLLGLTRFWEQVADMEWLQLTWRPNNPFPQLAYGEYASRVESPFSKLRTNGYMVSTDNAAAAAGSATGATLGPATPVQLAVIEAHALATLGPHEFEARDLSQHLLGLQGLNDDYGRCGLGRCREVVVACDGHGIVGYALIEISSVGLNLSELLSTFQVLMVREAPAVQRQLIDAARARYFALGRRAAIALAPPEQQAAFVECGFVKEKEYSTWLGHRSGLRRYLEHLDRRTRRLAAPPKGDSHA